MGLDRTGWGDGAGPDWTGPDAGVGRTRATSAEHWLPIKDHGPCFGTNEHPRRDTDVILRQSKAPDQSDIRGAEASQEK